MARRAPTFDPTRVYDVEARRSGGWWALTVPDLPGVHSQVRRLEQAEAMITDAIALAFDVDRAHVKVYGAIPIVNPDVDELRETTLEQRRQLAQLRVDVDLLSRKLAQDMACEGIPVRDIATALDVSFQHAAKLARRAS
jgi:predicted RNase H-like HicB family nuclease